MDQIQLAMEHVSLYYGLRPVLKDVNLTISPHKTTVVLGPSGSGKSMLLKTLAGLFPVNHGAVRLNGGNILSLSEKEEREFRSKCSFVFQDAALWENRSVKQNVHFPLEVHYPDLSYEQRQKKVENCLEQVGYWDSMDYRPSQLSAGERKMVSFARALIINPDFLFLDDPLVGIDSSAAGKIIDIIKRSRHSGKTIVACFSDPELISMIADELIIVNKGSVLIHDTFDAVRRSKDPLIRNILSLVLDQAATYDSDILSLLDDNGGLY